MAMAGDTYMVTIKEAHLRWGTHRHTNSRGLVYGEGYIKIPLQYAKSFNIFNHNHSNADILGINIFNCSSRDGFFNNITIKAAGSSTAGDIYAKQLQGNGSLQVIGNWYRHVNAQVGDIVKVTWTSSTDLIIEKI